MKVFGTQIYAAVQSGKLKEPFDAAMVKRACPGWSDRTYHTFLSKHAVGNPDDNTPLFVRVGRGLYRLNVRMSKA